MNKEWNIKVQFITFYKFSVTGEVLNKTQTRVKSNGVEFIYNVVKENINNAAS